MKFGDKLVFLRKKNGLSQEDLAEKLGVSRQSVSKWESNNTYPETDKIIQICDLFDCSMDDLINDKITNMEELNKTSKNNLNEAWDSLLDFITKTINMFSHFSFINGLKCIIEMVVACFLLWLVGSIFCSIASSIISNLFSFADLGIVNTIKSIIKSILSIFWFILTIIVLIHTFKIRYLNYYEFDNDNHDNTNNSNIDDNKLNYNINEDKNIKYNDTRPFAFLGILSKIIIYFIKFIVILMTFGFICSTICLTVLDVLSISLIGINSIFLGISLSTVTASVISILLLMVCINFVISRKINIKLYVIIFIVSLILFGVGIGISVLSFKNIDFIENRNNEYLNEENVSISYHDNLAILSYNNKQYNYVYDENLNDNEIIISLKYDKRFETAKKHDSVEDNIDLIYIYPEFNKNYKALYNSFVNDLKNNKIYINSDTDNNPFTIKANSNTINKLLTNLEKLYLVEKNYNEGSINVIIHESKVYFPNGITGNYNAIDDSLELYDEDMYCERSIHNTKWGDRIIYNCMEKDYD